MMITQKKLMHFYVHSDMDILGSESAFLKNEF
jgi:hypothetical protein